MLRVAATLVLILAATAGVADEAHIRKVLEAKLNGVRIDGVQPAPVAGLFEVRFRTAEGVQIVYTDATASNIVIGNIYEAKTDRNLTEERIRKLSAIRFEALPLELAVKVQRGNGRRVLAVFSDPYCPACQQFEKVLAQMDDITIHYFMFPMIRPELADHSKSVWCSPDRPKAWLDLALRRKPPVLNIACDHPVDKVLELGKTLGVRATPTLIFANGERTSGGLPATRLRVMLDEVAAAARPAAR